MWTDILGVCRKEYYNCTGYLKCPNFSYILLLYDSQECTIYQSTRQYTPIKNYFHKWNYEEATTSIKYRPTGRIN